ncbi:MAG: tRNA (guanosine(37)-N1)-methyltransferase TrmD [bacterium]|nr:tRNA (guanosine(37)-N1)-methyltransferase TrmD [bacterium]
MRIDILTLFPEICESPINYSILGRAQKAGLLKLVVTNIRDFSHDSHKKVDDYSYGGGPGMVLRPGPIFEAVESLPSGKVILMTPAGRVFNQTLAKELSGESHLIFVCGHYEGVDERIRKELVDLELSIGDYVLTGGELPALVVTEAVVRLIPGVLGNEESAVHDSFSDHVLDYPHYTRPQEFRGMLVPEVLLSGHHEKIRQWRRKEALLRTLERRPDLLAEVQLSEKEEKLA